MRDNSYSIVKIRNRNSGLDLYVVQITCPLIAGFDVFSNAKDASDHLAEEKRILDGYGYHLECDESGELYAGLLAEYENARELFTRLANRQVYIKYR